MSSLFWRTEARMVRLQPFFAKSHGRPRVDGRRVLSGIIFGDRNGLRWCDAPREHGPPKTRDNRWKRWSRMRNRVGRCFDKPKNARRVAPRYGKAAEASRPSSTWPRSAHGSAVHQHDLDGTMIRNPARVRPPVRSRRAHRIGRPTGWHRTKPARSAGSGAGLRHLTHSGGWHNNCLKTASEAEACCAAGARNMNDKAPTSSGGREAAPTGR